LVECALTLLGPPQSRKFPDGYTKADHTRFRKALLAVYVEQGFTFADLAGYFTDLDGRLFPDPS